MNTNELIVRWTSIYVAGFAILKSSVCFRSISFTMRAY